MARNFKPPLLIPTKPWEVTLVQQITKAIEKWRTFWNTIKKFSILPRNQYLFLEDTQ